MFVSRWMEDTYGPAMQHCVPGKAEPGIKMSHFGQRRQKAGFSFKILNLKGHHPQAHGAEGRNPAGGVLHRCPFTLCFLVRCAECISGPEGIRFREAQKQSA